MPQLEQEQPEPQLQLEEPEQPQSPFILMVVWGLKLVVGERIVLFALWLEVQLMWIACDDGRMGKVDGLWGGDVGNFIDSKKQSSALAYRAYTCLPSSVWPEQSSAQWGGDR